MHSYTFKPRHLAADELCAAVIQPSVDGAEREQAGVRILELPPDATVARILAELPALRQWANQPLEPHVQQIINSADTQALMSMAAHVISRLVIEDHTEPAA